MSYYCPLKNLLCGICAYEAVSCMGSATYRISCSVCKEYIHTYLCEFHWRSDANEIVKMLELSCNHNQKIIGTATNSSISDHRHSTLNTVIIPEFKPVIKTYPCYICDGINKEICDINCGHLRKAGVFDDIQF